jgi:sterol desaturase/sphingolipid hydroxylase (fatty acid hydroxylase superfamily)
VLLAVGVGCALLWAEHRRPLRTARESKLRRKARNLSIAALAGAAVRWGERPLVDRLAQRVERKRQGVIQLLPIDAVARDLLTVVAMDYTLYVWHVLTHWAPVLYRLHQVHHADRELDASTALRFHFLEMLASIPWRAAQVRAFGASPRALAWWRQFTTASILFHHSNVRLPMALERILWQFVMTPRLHAIHHANDPVEQSSNWSSGLTLWDRLHGTLRTTVRDAVELGLPGERSPQPPTLMESLTMPMRSKFAGQPAAGERSARP